MQPVPPVDQPEVAAEAIDSVIQRPVNELWVGKAPSSRSSARSSSLACSIG